MVQQSTKDEKSIIICPHRFLERKQLFMDCIHLLTIHEPGNELHIFPEIAIPGGNVDFVLASVNRGKVLDFVGIELQALDTTGTLWYQRERFLQSVGIERDHEYVLNPKPYGINWKMTAKTTLMQLHHKIETFESLNKHLVLVLQDCLLDYMRRTFSFAHIQNARIGDSLHFHAYSLQEISDAFRLELISRNSTDARGLAVCLGLQASSNVELATIISLLESRISERTLLTI